MQNSEPSIIHQSLRVKFERLHYFDSFFIQHSFFKALFTFPDSQAGFRLRYRQYF